MVQIPVSIISFISFALHFLLVEGFITRLPKCRYSANYTSVRDGKYFKADVISRTITNVNRKRCSLYCTFNEECAFFNHKKDNTTCELVSTHAGKFESNADWQVISTDYKDLFYRGPYCRYIRPTKCNNKHSYCIDTCESPGYKCHPFTTDKKILATGSSSYSNLIPKKAFDSNLKTYWLSGWTGNQWVKLDLGKKYRILFVTIDSSVKTDYAIKDIEIRVDGELCAGPLDIPSFTVKKCACNDGDNEKELQGQDGRFVKLEKIKQGVLNFVEIYVYAI